MGIQLHSVKRLSPKTEDFVVISRSKLDPYQDDLLYGRVIKFIALTMGFLPGLGHEVGITDSLLRTRWLRQKLTQLVFISW